MTDEALWALGRGTGVTALMMLTVSMVLGIATRSGRGVAGLPRFGVMSLHQFASLAATSLIAVHVTTLVVDPYAQLDLVDVVVPFGGAYEWFWVGLGTLTLDLTMVLVVSALVRHRIGQRAFRAIHWVAYGLWPIAVVHGLGAGSDSGAPWMWVITGCCVAAVLVAVGMRRHPRFTDFSRPREVATT
ncbi:ferric reductase-like transmembrane domain-containing protein [Williamsia sp. MIQD14]|uniref:ferric reductase-like transmembrane domain-containing protein n=1 Tax=Williamsia sp. MIQD14 TaxID=3425703 RepID=UPI003DA057B2